MRYRRNIGIVALATILACGSASAATLTEADTKNVVNVKVGEPVVIRLKSDTTSPVQWIWTGDINFAVLSAGEVTSEPGTSPNEEIRIYNFKSISKGDSKIMFFLRRGGEGPDDGVMPLIYSIHVE